MFTEILMTEKCYSCVNNAVVNLYLEVTPRSWADWLICVCIIVVISTKCDIV